MLRRAFGAMAVVVAAGMAMSLAAEPPAAIPARVHSSQPATADDPDQPPDQSPKLDKQVQLQQKQIEVQQKQIETLEQMVRRLQTSVTPATVGELENKSAELESRSLRAARRDQDLARAVDDLTEKLDNEQRYGPRLPSNLKQLFLPSRTNQTPLSIYGTFVTSYSDLGNQAPNFDTEFAPFFLLTLNEQFLLEAELEFGPEGVELGQGQLDWILNDWATLVVGRFLAPLGFYNERLHSGWINKLPDNPLMFRQVAPTDFSQNGLQLRGGKYLGASPIKLEYAGFVSNGMGVEGEMLELTEIANLNEMRETAENINNGLAFGGRLGLWVPEYGLTGGVSALWNDSYTEASGNDLTLWQLDAGWRHGNWDLRAEYAELAQDATAIIGNDIKRRGLYAQIGYRPNHAGSPLLQNTEFLFRYSFANFRGIDFGDLELDEFASTLDVPVNRNQYTFGITHWLYPSLALKFAYQINAETGPVKFNDNAFLAQMAWGF